MAKFSKRQIMILLVAVIAVLFGVYEIFFGGQSGKSSSKAQSNPVEINTLVSGISGNLLKNTPIGIDAYLIGRAEEKWEADPFLQRALYAELMAKENEGSGAAEEKSAVKIVYSGYIDAGKTKMAIINGVEYRAGEKLEIEGYVLKRITPSRILVLNKNTGSETEIPIQE
ncbi:MAG TPA: hypothetical protein PKZ12_01960 [Smithellaceae bacterium]|nr:hypothetical protein [Smithellaceae bacterium]